MPRLLWDHGGLWSLMAWQTLRELGLPIKLISAAEIASGGLAGARLLMVPGGWPSLKSQALGQAGAQAIREFVAAGGDYFGICGGAGLGLDVPDGLGLLPLGRVDQEQRLPSLSGPVICKPGPGATGHPLWANTRGPQEHYVWFPAGFQTPTQGDIQVIAEYLAPGPGLCSADLWVHQQKPEDWPALEEKYGIKLDPGSLSGRPAVIQGAHGQGRVLLSYLHYDTTGHPPGHEALTNLWQAWLGLKASPPEQAWPAPGFGPLDQAARRAEELWEEGNWLGLWEPRHPALPLWKRGARGLEFWALARMARALADLPDPDDDSQDRLLAALEPILDQGEQVLQAQAGRLESGAGDPPGDSLEASWFPRPRQTAGQMAKALEMLDKALFKRITDFSGGD